MLRRYPGTMGSEEVELGSASTNPFLDASMFKRNCIVNYVDNLGVEHAPRLRRNRCSKPLSAACTDWIRVFGLKSGVFDRMCITVDDNPLRS